MNCHEAKNHLFADRDDALDNPQRVALDTHVAQCADCRRIRDDLAAAFTTWCTENTEARLPDIEREWHAVRRKIRGGVKVGQETRSPRRLVPWLALPLAAAAALALTFYVAPRDDDRSGTTSKAPRTQVARADSVEVPGNASTSVYVDDKSGWLIVWASDAKEI